jgi:3-oxoacyl-[acyl-carrier protein] reductase
MELVNRVVVVTGAAQGLGEQIAKRLGVLGAKLALIDLNQSRLNSVCEQLNQLDIDAKGYTADISSETQVEQVFHNILSDFARVDGLVNNAGIIRDQFLNKLSSSGQLESLSLSNWQSVIDVNLTGVFLCSREASKAMIAHKSKGVIVNISSISKAGNIGQSNYSASKAGVASLTVTWAKELARYGIRVGAVAPGFIETEMTKSIKPQVLKHIESSVPLARMGKPDEIAHTVQFIFENDYFSGRVIEVDGGLRI